MSQGDIRIKMATGFTHHIVKTSRKLPDARAVDRAPCLPEGIAPHICIVKEGCFSGCF